MRDVTRRALEAQGFKVVNSRAQSLHNGLEAIHNALCYLDLSSQEDWVDRLQLAVNTWAKSEDLRTLGIDRE